jgi:hypothetical protein
MIDLVMAQHQVIVEQHETIERLKKIIENKDRMIANQQAVKDEIGFRTGSKFSTDSAPTTISGGVPT